MNPEIVKRFNIFRAKTEKYADLELDKVEFENQKLSNKSIFTFIKGQNKYIRKSIAANPGEIPVLGASLDNACIAAYVTPLSPKDLIDKKCISFNKDNAKGSRAFYRDYPFVMDRHHIAIIPDSKQMYPKYLYFYLDSVLRSESFGWGENVATIEAVEVYDVPIPKTNEQYSSVTLQQMFVEFIEFHAQRHEHNLSKINRIGAMWDKMESLVLPLTFAKEKSAARRFNIFCQKNGYELTLEEVEFEDIDIFNHKDVNLQGSKKLANHNKLKMLNDHDGLPVYDASSSILTYVKKDKYPNCVFQAASDKNPDLSFANEGNSSAGTNFFLHTGEYFVNNHRTVVDFSKSKFLSKYVYHSIKDMKERYGFRRGYIPSQSELSRLKIAISIPKDSEAYSSWEIQNITSNYFDSYLNWIKKIKQIISHINHLIPRYNQTFITTTFNAMKRQAQ